MIRAMRRIGPLLWAAWGYEILSGPLARRHGMDLRSLRPGWLWSLAGGSLRAGMSGLGGVAVLAGISFLAAFGRAAEWIYVAAVPWALVFPRCAPAIAAGGIIGATAAQWLVWAAWAWRRFAASRAARAERRDAWLCAQEGDPVFSRSGQPLNRAAWRQLTPDAFERETLELFRLHGFAGDLTPPSGDEGIDLELCKGGRCIVVQCKQYRGTVGQPALRDFAGAMRGAGADIGYFVTTAEFTEPAIRWAEALDEPRIILVDGRDLARWAHDGRVPI